MSGHLALETSSTWKALWNKKTLPRKSVTKTKKNVLEEKIPVAEEKTNASQVSKSLVPNKSKLQSVCICQVHGSISAITQLPGGNALQGTNAGIERLSVEWSNPSACYYLPFPVLLPAVHWRCVTVVSYACGGEGARHLWFEFAQRGIALYKIYVLLLLLLFPFSVDRSEARLRVPRESGACLFHVIPVYV